MPRDVAHPIDKHVGAKLRLRRTTLGMSQSTLAEALGLTFQQVQKYENGANRIGAGRLQQIAHILEVPVESFFEGLPHEPGRRRVPTDAPDMQYVADYLATADGHELANAFMQIPNPKLRRSIVKLVEQLAATEDQLAASAGDEARPFFTGPRSQATPTTPASASPRMMK